MAHNIQLVVKDGLKLNPEYNALIDRVSTNIVTKSKLSHVIAEELRNLNININTKNVTRWNSILFTVRQVLKLSPQDLKQIRDQLPNKTSDEKERRKKFDISEIEREMLMELKDLLQMFEFVTDELQSNRINISRVYPCIEYLRENLINHEKIKSGEVKYKYTQQMRLDLLTSLNKRFSHLIDQDVFIASI
jgi:hypothetical protein